MDTLNPEILALLTRRVEAATQQAARDYWSWSSAQVADLELGEMISERGDSSVGLAEVLGD